MINKKYYWKELTSDGLLKEPNKCGPHYSTESLNGFGGFDNEDEAFKKLEYMKKVYPYDTPSLITLVIQYNVCSDTEN